MVMTLITPDSLDLICNDEAALRRVHRSAPFARRSGAVAALAARGAGRDHALADANRGSAAQPLRPPFGPSRRRGAATGHRGRRAIFGRTGSEARGGSARRATAREASETQSRFVAGASAPGGGRGRYRRQDLRLLRRVVAYDRRRPLRDAGLRPGTDPRSGDPPPALWLPGEGAVVHGSVMSSRRLFSYFSCLRAA